MAGSKGDKYYDIFLNYAFWLQSIDGRKLLNEESFLLLFWISKLGSIKLAAEEIKISYRKAWNLISKSEKMLGFNLVIKNRGGKDGGHTSLSIEGQNLVNAYNDLKSEFNLSIKNVTKKFFHKLNQKENI